MRWVFHLTVAAVFAALPAVHAQEFVPPLEINGVQARTVDGQVTLELQAIRYAKETRVRNVEVEGQKREISYIVQVPVVRKIVLNVDGMEVRVFDLQGKSVEIKELPMRLGMNGAVVMSPSGKVPLQFQQILREDTLVLSITGEAARTFAE